MSIGIERNSATKKRERKRDKRRTLRDLGSHRHPFVDSLPYRTPLSFQLKMHHFDVFRLFGGKWLETLKNIVPSLIIVKKCQENAHL